MARRSGLGKGPERPDSERGDGGDRPLPPGGADLAHPAERLPAPEPLRRGVDGVAGRLHQGGGGAAAGAGAPSCRTRRTTYELIAGERRWRAARRAGLQTIPVLVQVADDVASLEQALVENLHRVRISTRWRRRPPTSS